VRGFLIASGITPDNTPHGYNWTFLFPMLLFIIIAGALYLVLTRPHEVPGHGTLPLTARGAAGGRPGAGNVAAATAHPQATQPAGATAVAGTESTEQTQAAETQEGPEDSE
jgi:hypothetical protein